MPVKTSFLLSSVFVLAAQAAPDWKPVSAALDATCLSCHNDKKNKGGVNLEPLLKDPQVEAEFALWEKVRHVVEAGEMPPEDADEILLAEKTALIAWINASLTEVAQRNAGDPGPVTLRRLTNFEYDNTLRDLTGQDYRPSKEFQPDGGGGEGRRDKKRGRREEKRRARDKERKDNGGGGGQDAPAADEAPARLRGRLGSSADDQRPRDRSRDREDKLERRDSRGGGNGGGRRRRK